MKDNGFKLTKERSRRCPAQTMTDADYADDIAGKYTCPSRNPATWSGTSSWWHRPLCQRRQDRIHVFNLRSDISTLNGSSLKLVDKFTYQVNSVSSTEVDINTRLAKAWKAIDRLSII